MTCVGKTGYESSRETSGIFTERESRGTGPFPEPKKKKGIAKRLKYLPTLIYVDLMMMIIQKIIHIRYALRITRAQLYTLI